MGCRLPSTAFRHHKTVEASLALNTIDHEERLLALSRAPRKKAPEGALISCAQWRPGSESNRRTRLCRPLHDHSATWPLRRTATITGPVLLKKQNPGSPRFCLKTGAGNETRTRDPDLGKVVLYQLSYSRIGADNYSRTRWDVNTLLTPLRTVRASYRNHFRRRRRVRPHPARHIVRYPIAPSAQDSRSKAGATN